MSASPYSGGRGDKDQPARLDRQWREWRGLLRHESYMTDYQILRTQFRVADFLSWQRHGTLELNPIFQRRSVWKKGAKSYLIDTIVRGLSIPIIFLRELPADLQTLQAKREVVDGQQRLRTVLAYIAPDSVKNFDPARDDFRIESVHNEELGGKSFPQLDREFKQRILDYQFSVHVFPSDTDDRQILQIFARMNATGLNLNSQELRNAEFFGHFKTSAYNIATEQLNRWRDWGIFTGDQIARMNEVEITSEFMQLIMDGVLEKDNTLLSSYYRDFDETFPDQREVEARFRFVMDYIERHFPESAIKVFSGRTLFYALFATIYGLQYGLRMPPEGRRFSKGALFAAHVPLEKASPRAISRQLIDNIHRSAALIQSDKAPENVLRATRGATSHAVSRRAVICFLAGDENDPCRPVSQ